MNRHTSRRVSPDTQRIGAATAREGNDPRRWCDMGVVEEIDVSDEGVFFEVKLDSGPEVRVRYATQYAGDGFGFYSMPAVGDDVYVQFPAGHHGDSPFVECRSWSKAHKPPALAVSHQEDVLLATRPGKTLRLTVAGGGTVVLVGPVKLGSEAASLSVARETDNVSIPLPGGYMDASNVPHGLLDPTFTLGGTISPRDGKVKSD